MKHSSLIFSFLLISFIAKSQVVIVNESDRRLRLGVPNRLRIMAKNISSDKLLVKATVGTITKYNDGYCEWLCCDSDKNNTWIKVYNGSKILDSVHYLIEKIRDPILSTAFHRDSLYKNEWAVGVRADRDFRDEGVYIGEAYQIATVLKFDIEIIKTSGQIIKFVNSGPYFTKEFTANYKMLQYADKVVLKNFIVNVVCEDKPRKLAQTFSYTYSGRIVPPEF